MNSLRMLVAGSVLISLAACAAQSPRPETQSILDVLDEEASAPMASQKVCAGNQVTYCEINLGARHCACKDQGEVSLWLGRLNGVR